MKQKYEDEKNQDTRMDSQCNSEDARTASEAEVVPSTASPDHERNKPFVDQPMRVRALVYAIGLLHDRVKVEAPMHADGIRAYAVELTRLFVEATASEDTVLSPSVSPDQVSNKPDDWPVLRTDTEAILDYAEGLEDGGEIHWPKLLRALVQEVHEYRAAIDANQVRHEPQAWRDIASAPQTGMPVLLYYSNPGGMIEMGMWRDGIRVDRGDIRCGWRYLRSHSVKYDLDHQPTHWMPLPASPSDAANQGDSRRD